jgi:hypothetical protein
MLGLLSTVELNISQDYQKNEITCWMKLETVTSIAAQFTMMPPTFSV